jgi:protein FAM32A
VFSSQIPIGVRAMGTEDYTASVGGSLKLKGVKDSKVTKHKSKKNNKKPKDEQSDNATEGAKTREQALNRALASEEEKEERDDEQRQEEIGGIGKTEAERRHDERRRKRVGCPLMFIQRRKGSAERARGEDDAGELS